MTHFPYVGYFFFLHRSCVDNFKGRYQVLFAFFFINIGCILSGPLDLVSLTLSIAFFFNISFRDLK